MGTDGKWDFARQLAIGLGHIRLKAETLSFSTWSDEQIISLERKALCIVLH